MKTKNELEKICKDALNDFLKEYEKNIETPIEEMRVNTKEKYFDIIVEQDVIITKKTMYSVKAKNAKEAGEKVLYDYSKNNLDVKEISTSYLENTEDYFGLEERPNSFRIIDPKAKGKKRILYQE